MSRGVEERIAWFATHLPDREGMCLRHTWQATDLPAVGQPDANAGWQYVKDHGELQDGNPPRGAWVWWSSPTHGHVALSAGDGMIWSTDVHGPRTIGKVSIAYPANAWGHKLVGWSDWYGEHFEVGDMALTERDLDRIAAAVWSHDIENTTTEPKGKRPARWFLNTILGRVK